MIFSDSEIRNRMKFGQIQIHPFNEELIGSNSYDVLLGDEMKIVISAKNSIVDPFDENSHGLRDIPLEKNGAFLLIPNFIFLASTLEEVKCYGNDFVPMIEGKSSLARLGLKVHFTSGFGDVGFSGRWVMEIETALPIYLYPRMPIAQIYFVSLLGSCKKDYPSKSSAKYLNQMGVVGSKYHLNKVLFEKIKYRERYLDSGIAGLEEDGK